MNRETGVRFAVALLAVASLGVTATTLESTLSTDANDVIDLEYDNLPIGQDDASALVDEIEGGGDGDQKTQTETGDQGDSQSTETTEGSGDASRQTQGDGEEQSHEETVVPDGVVPVEPSLLDRLLALLLQLLPVLLVLLALAVTGALAVRYRDRLLAYFEDPEADQSPERDPDAVAEWHGKAPTNPVEQAWVEMVSRLDPDRPGAMTPEECARAAVRAGFDREAVQSLTEAFVEVRYGSRAVDDRYEEIARESRRRLGSGGDL